MPFGRERLSEQWVQHPEVGNAIIDAGHPARLKVTIKGDQEAFMIQVIAHADRGLQWDRAPRAGHVCLSGKGCVSERPVVRRCAC
jgi:hypothetical protein